MRISVVCLIGLGSLGLASCATEEFQYVPSEHQSASSRVRDEAIYAVPPDAPSGSLRVVSNGIEKVKTGKDAKEQPALHLKLALSNKSLKQSDWVVDTREQTVSFPNTEPVYPILSQPGTSFSGQIKVAPGELKTVDLYFPLPQSVRSSEDLPEFDFHWKLRSGEKLVQNTTLFDRIRRPEYLVSTYPSAFYPYYFGVGPVWYGGAGGVGAP